MKESPENLEQHDGFAEGHVGNHQSLLTDARTPEKKCGKLLDTTTGSNVQDEQEILSLCIRNTNHGTAYGSLEHSTSSACGGPVMMVLLRLKG